MANSVLHIALIFFGAAIVFVPIAKRAGIGSVLGYILGGIIIGPFVLGLIGHEGEDIMHAAEFGVVMMLFLVGLELNPDAFWKMGKKIAGLGGLQMLGTAVLLFPILHYAFHMDWSASLALALTFAMSSTAIILQTLKEKGIENTESGKSSFAVLLFQDIAVIPILALLPLLVLAPEADAANLHHRPALPEALGFLTDYPSLTILLAVGLIYLASRYLINPMLRRVARTHMRELFTAAALFIVVAVAGLMHLVGVSAALGTFLAGVLLANSEYRHELESDVEPFKGLLLGMFFTAVGSTINFALIVHQPLDILSAVLIIMGVKSVVLFGVAKLYKFQIQETFLFVLLLSQVGEFGFVLLNAAGQLGILDRGVTDFYMAVVTVTMIATPFLLFGFERFLAKRFAPVLEAAPEGDVISEENAVILAGFGNFGSTLGRFLRANGIEATILDSDIDRVLFLRKMGFKVHFGDATRLNLLEAAGADKAKVFISAINSAEKNLQLLETLKKHFPHLKVFTRVRDRFEAYEFIDNGVEKVYRETLHTSVFMGVDVLAELGLRRYTLMRKAQEFLKYDEQALKKLAGERYDMDNYINSAREEIAQQERLLKEDRRFRESHPDGAWDKTGLAREAG